MLRINLIGYNGPPKFWWKADFAAIVVGLGLFSVYQLVSLGHTRAELAAQHADVDRKEAIHNLKTKKVRAKYSQLTAQVELYKDSLQLGELERYQNGYEIQEYLAQLAAIRGPLKYTSVALNGGDWVVEGKSPHHIAVANYAERLSQESAPARIENIISRRGNKTKAVDFTIRVLNTESGGDE